MPAQSQFVLLGAVCEKRSRPSKTQNGTPWNQMRVECGRGESVQVTVPDALGSEFNRIGEGQMVKISGRVRGQGKYNDPNLVIEKIELVKE